MRRALLLLAVLATALASAAAASAEIVTRPDDEGRTITFDVLAPDVDVDAYAGLLRAAAHGDEISRVTIRIVPRGEIRTRCGAGASACYRRDGAAGTMVVPAGPVDEIDSILLHEYGHHLDAAWAVAGVRELNGTPVWWASRGMTRLLESGSVAFDYSLGWERSIGEIFAEDYAYVHLGGTYELPWLAPPDEALRTALLAELAAGPTTPVPPGARPPQLRPVTIVRQGRLGARSAHTVPFGLLGPGRRVTVNAKLLGARAAGTVGRLDVRCDDRLVRSVPVRRGRTATIDRRDLGPARCTVRLLSTRSESQRFELRVKLTLQALAPPLRSARARG